MRTPKIVHTLVCLFAALCAGQASAAWSLVENFNALSQGNLNAQAGWTVVNGAGGASTVVVDPDDAANQVVQVIADGRSYRALGGGIANGASGTLFFRIRAPDVTNISFGLSDVAAPDANFFNFEAQMRTYDDNGAANINQIDVRNGAAFTTVGSYTPDVWRNYWMVINNQTDTYSFYSSVGSNPAVPLGAGNYSFRNGLAANALDTVLIRQALHIGGIPPTSNDQYIDDIYLDTAGQNLTSPLPVLVLGDTDGDGVGGEFPDDFYPIRDNFRKAVSMRSSGDLVPNGSVDFADFREWKTAHLSGGGASLEDLDLGFLSSNVPEPSAAMLTAIALFGLLAAREKRTSGFPGDQQ